MKEDTSVYDITVIGGGPVGLFTAFYGGMRQASVKLIESLPHLGGQLTALYPDKYIYDVAGFPKVKAQELVDNLTAQMSRFDTEIRLGQEVTHVEKREDGVFVLTTPEEVHYTRTIIITAGNGAFQPRKLNLDGLNDFEEKNLHYFIEDLSNFKDQDVVLLGGGDSAVDWALMLEPVAKSVTLVHRRDTFRAHEASVEQLKQSSVNVMTPYVPVGYQTMNDVIQSLTLQKAKEEETTVLNFDHLIVNYGFVSSLGPIKEWTLEIEKNSIVVNSRMETNIPGIYAAGDVCTYDGKVKLIASGFGEAPTAVNNAKASIDPKARVQPMHSTSMFS
ncbi:NAD(P)/FAD-dependent oxidoreductase [Jeotgalibacillus haloalkalitolerans]|uniref:Ferredoxin--NADP reductase n=1 Tax=Jeotgalibacillus haloalkalitolerans TaxID=3104292 RepID=A0ABU5KRA0_9BACL|nr:NAD(P)/FAD-dependent oxidoreductase [Jeotgalibacillus sp. HH7-29]MDZ5713623.1 NAD(P)/FAD-dependent oxidoreductase [Jeotgalibacillus sp. HH7-29]